MVQLSVKLCLAPLLLSSVGQCALRGKHAAQDVDFNCDGQPEGAFEAVTLSNKQGTLRAAFIPYGATLTHLVFSNGAHVDHPVDVVLGWDDAKKGYCEAKGGRHTYFGATIGRVANRIAHGSFRVDGVKYRSPLNEKDYDTLHGGFLGFDRRVFRVFNQTANSVTFEYVSPDGEEGFPGKLTLQVTHTITDQNEWKLHYHAWADKDTPVALTNHAYFNLNGNINNTATVLEHVMSIPTGDRFVEVDDHLLPSGVLGSVSNASYLDFRTAKQIGRDIDQGKVTPLGGYDNAWVFKDWNKTNRTEQALVEVSSSLTGIGLRMFTDQPSVQIYSGNFLNGTDPELRIPRKRSQSFGTEPQYYQWRGAFTLEAQHYPDSLHHNSFPTIILKKGDVYTQDTTYQLFTVQ